jgi:hypothetical protein
LVEQKTGGRLRQLKEGVESEGWRFVAFVRLVPLLPFNRLNYALGLTRIRLTHYIVASYLGMLPPHPVMLRDWELTDEGFADIDEYYEGTPEVMEFSLRRWIPEPFWDEFRAVHSRLFDVEFYRKTQEQLRQGHVPEFYAYPEGWRLSSYRAAPDRWTPPSNSGSNHIASGTLVNTIRHRLAAIRSLISWSSASWLGALVGIRSLVRAVQTIRQYLARGIRRGREVSGSIAAVARSFIKATKRHARSL